MHELCVNVFEEIGIESGRLRSCQARTFVGGTLYGVVAAPVPDCVCFRRGMASAVPLGIKNRLFAAREAAGAAD